MKSFSDLEQSKKLAEILPIESADMYWEYDFTKHECILKIMDEQFDDTCICAWSLAALMAVIPYNVNFNKAVYRFKMVKYSEHWECYHENFGSVSTEIFKADNPIDACYEMILKLHELKML